MHIEDALIKSIVAGLLASLACGLGVLPLLIGRLDPKLYRGLGYATAGGLMFAASVYNLILPGLQMEGQQPDLSHLLRVVCGIVLGAVFLSLTDRWLVKREFSEKALAGWGGKTGLLIFIAMAVHSIPEGVAVGTGYATGKLDTPGYGEVGSYIALAIALHNIPEGLAVGIPMRSAGAGIGKCFGAAFLTSLPQPIAAVPAVLLAWAFEPLMPVLLGFAAGAMIFLVLMELIPDALATEKPRPMAWAFTVGFCLMLLIQILL